MSEIKNCPFCGGIATIQQDTRYPRYGKKDTVKAYEPICTNTDCLIYKADNVYFTSEKKAIAAWNRRAQPENEPIVRCGECESYLATTGKCYCGEYNMPSVKENHYCGYGRRKPERSEG